MYRVDLKDLARLRLNGRRLPGAGAGGLRLPVRTGYLLARHRGQHAHGGRAARRGILIKGVSALVKTGTLTTGSPALVDWLPLGDADRAAAAAAWLLASRSDHPVARAIAAGLPAASGDVQDVRVLTQ